LSTHLGGGTHAAGSDPGRAVLDLPGAAPKGAAAARFDEFNEVFARYFPAGSPARIFLCVPVFPGSFDSEIDCIAVI